MSRSQNGYILGITRYDDGESTLFSRRRCLARIMIAFAGLEAEKILRGDFDNGAQFDLISANNMVYNMVHNYGMSDGDLEGVLADCLSSQKYLAELDKKKIEILKKCKIATRKLLEAHKQDLENLALVLLEKKRLSQEEIYEIIGEPSDEMENFLDFAFCDNVIA